MSCVAANWTERNPRWHYRSCYDERGRMCCRADVRKVELGQWVVSTTRAGELAVSWGTWLSESAARHLARGKLLECGCTGLNGGLGRLRRAKRGRRRCCGR